MYVNMSRYVVQTILKTSILFLHQLSLSFHFTKTTKTKRHVQVSSNIVAIFPQQLKLFSFVIMKKKEIMWKKKTSLHCWCCLLFPGFVFLLICHPLLSICFPLLLIDFHFLLLLFFLLLFCLSSLLTAVLKVLISSLPKLLNFKGRTSIAFCYSEKNKLYDSILFWLHMESCNITSWSIVTLNPWCLITPQKPGTSSIMWPRHFSRKQGLQTETAQWF